jgi:hypothetical protein
VTVDAHEDGSGGAYVIVDPVDPGAPYAQRETWFGFQITFQYPVADCYPHFVRPDLARADGAPLGEAMTVTRFGFDQRPALQVSRRSNRLNPAHDTALTKLWKVLEWMASR